MNKYLVFFLLTLQSISVLPAFTQIPEPPPGPVYIVREGDTLWDIAYLFNVSVADLINYNDLPGQDIFVGDRLIIPGLENLEGILSIRPVTLGENIRNLSRQQNMDIPALIALNHIVSPSELYIGYELILVQQEDSTVLKGRMTMKPGETLLDQAVLQNTQLWVIKRLNDSLRPATLLPGDELTTLNDQSTFTPSGFPSVISSIEIDPLPIIQGSTVQIKVTSKAGVTLGGFLADKALHFFSTEDGTQVALQGVYAMIEPGIYPFHLFVNDNHGTQENFEQMVLIKSGNFISETLFVDESLIDPSVTEPEDKWLKSTVSQVTSEKYWQGIFQYPVATDTYCLRSGFGNLRAYNDGELYSYHTGIDFGVCSESHPFDIYTPASGRVIFVGEKTVRGNVTIIDHGWGIYSGMWHQADFYVSTGDYVEVGKLIGMIGATGRVTGPHLHWEIWVNGVQVDPLPWLETEYPH